MCKQRPKPSNTWNITIQVEDQNQQPTRTSAHFGPSEKLKNLKTNQHLNTSNLLLIDSNIRNRSSSIADRIRTAFHQQHQKNHTRVPANVHTINCSIKLNIQHQSSTYFLKKHSDIHDQKDPHNTTQHNTTHNMAHTHVHLKHTQSAGGQQPADGGRRTADRCGRRTADGGRQADGGGRRTAADGRTAAGSPTIN